MNTDRSSNIPVRLATLAASALLLTATTATVSFARDRAEGDRSSSHQTQPRDDRGHGRSGDAQRPDGGTPSGQPAGSSQPAAKQSSSGTHTNPGTTPGSTHSASADAAGGKSAPAATAAGTGGGAPAGTRVASSNLSGSAIASARGTASQDNLAASAGADAPAEQVLAANTSTTPVFGIAAPVSSASGDLPTNVSHAAASVSSFYGVGSQPDPVKLLVILAWLALNGGIVILVRRRAAHGKRSVFFPVNLGAHTYRSSTGFGA